MSAPELPPAPSTPRPHTEKIEPIVYLLLGATVYFATMMVVVSKLSPDDGQTFMALSGLAGTFSGALVMRIKNPQGSQGPAGPAGETGEPGETGRPGKAG